MESRQQNQHSSDGLTALEAEQRREMLLTSMEYDPRETWQKLMIEERQDKDFVVKALSAGIFHFPWCKHEQYRNAHDVDFPDELLDDRDAVLAYVSRKSIIDDFAFPVPESLRDDREVMLEVCRRNPRTLRLASPRLQDDEEIVFAALRQWREYNAPQQFEFASPRLRGDKDFILREIEHSVSEDRGDLEWLKFAALSIKDEKELALAVLKRKLGYALVFLPYCSPALRDDKDIMLQFIEYSPDALEYCSDRLKACEEVVNAAASKDPSALRYALGNYKEEFLGRDKATVLKGLQRFGACDEIPSEMKSDPEVLLEAVRSRSMAYEDLPFELRQKKDFIFAAVEADPANDFFEHIPEDLQQDENLCIQILKEEYYSVGSIFKKVPSLYQSKEAIMAMMKTDLLEIPLERYKIIEKSPFRDDAEFMLLACESESECIDLASEKASIGS